MWRSIATPKNHPNEMSTKHNFKRNLNQKKTFCFHIKNGKDWNRWKLMKTGFHQILSIRIFSRLLFMDFFNFLGGDVAWVFGRDFSPEILWLKLLFSCFAIKKSLERLYGDVSYIFWQRMSLQNFWVDIYLGIIFGILFWTTDLFGQIFRGDNFF